MKKHTKYKKILLKLKEKYQSSLNRKSDHELGKDVIDRANHEVLQYNSFYFRSNMQKTLGEIEAALERIANQSYGICEVLGIPIERKRLEAIPWTRVSTRALNERE